MTKQAYRRAQRVKSCGAAGLAACRKILAERQYRKVNEMMVDLFSASTFVAVCDALNDANREKLLALPIGQAISIAYKVTGLAE